MSRPDITGDAQQIKDVIVRGGVAILQGDVGYGLLTATPKAARKTIDVVIFRFDRAEIEEALKAAAKRGVQVTALITHANEGGEKSLRKLEMRLLEEGVTVSRTSNDLVRYHDKLMIIDRRSDPISTLSLANSKSCMRTTFWL